MLHLKNKNYIKIKYNIIHNHAYTLIAILLPYTFFKKIIKIITPQNVNFRKSPTCFSHLV